jgi:hypothetical protein
MKYYCKLVYKEKIEPTSYFEDQNLEDTKNKMMELIEQFFSDDGINGIYLGKK